MEMYINNNNNNIFKHLLEHDLNHKSLQKTLYWL